MARSIGFEPFIAISFCDLHGKFVDGAMPIAPIGMTRRGSADSSDCATGVIPTKPDRRRCVSGWSIPTSEAASAPVRKPGDQRTGFLYLQVLNRDLGELEPFIRAKRGRNLPVVLGRQVTGILLARREGIHKLIASRLYGSNLRQLEGLRLRLQDIDFDYCRIHVRQAKGKKDRYVALPGTLMAALQRPIGEVARLHDEDLKAGYGEAHLAVALARKYPNAGGERNGLHLFPSGRRAVDPHGGTVRRHPLHASLAQEAVKRAADTAWLDKCCCSHTCASRLCHPSAGG